MARTYYTISNREGYCVYIGDSLKNDYEETKLSFHLSKTDKTYKTRGSKMYSTLDTDLFNSFLRIYVIRAQQDPFATYSSSTKHSLMILPPLLGCVFRGVYPTISQLDGRIARRRQWVIPVFYPFVVHFLFLYLIPL